jgi:hypothetical protein
MMLCLAKIELFDYLIDKNEIDSSILNELLEDCKSLLTFSIDLIIDKKINNLPDIITSKYIMIIINYLIIDLI